MRYVIAIVMTPLYLVGCILELFAYMASGEGM
jgi:hypothetical protein